MTVRHLRVETPVLGFEWGQVVDLDDADPLIAALITSGRLTVVAGSVGPAQTYHDTHVVYSPSQPDPVAFTEGVVWVSAAGFALLQSNTWVPLGGGSGGGGGGTVSQYDIRSFLQGAETLDQTGATSIHTLLGRARDAVAANYVSTGRPGQIYVPAGRYRIDTRLTWKSGVGIRGESRDSVFFLPRGNQSFIHQNDRARNDDCAFSDFTIDGAAQTDTVYTAQVKGLYITDMRRARFERITIKNVWSSGFGTDYLHESIMVDCYAINCGRGIKQLGVDPATTSGGSGFGIGSGASQVESLQIVNCHSIDNGLHGFFTEKQNQVSYYSRGFTMTGCTARGNWIGFRDCGSIGALVSGNQFIDNGLCGVSLDKTVLAANAGQNGIIADNIISGNGALAGSVPGGGVVITQAALGGYTIRNNEISGNTGNGVYVPTTAVVASRFSIRDNRIHDNTAAGIAVRAATNLWTIAGNECFGNGTFGINLLGSVTASNLILTGNDCRSGLFNIAHTLTGAGSLANNVPVVEATVVAGDTTAPTVPTGLAVTPGSGQNDLSWTASTDAVGVTGYRVYRGGTLVGSPTGTTYTDTGLTNGTTYSYTVAAIDAAANLSAQSGAVTGTPVAVVDTTAPTVPTGLAVTPGNTTNVLTWTASTDAVGVTGYRVYRGGTLVGSPASTSYTDTGLTNGTTYSYTVAAADAAGNVSAQTAAVTGTPAAGAVTSPNIADTFTAADNTSLVNRVAPDGTSTATWRVDVTGTQVYGITGGHAKAISGASASSGFATLPASADGKAQATLVAVNPTAANRRAGLVFRYVDLSNYWRIVARPSSTVLVWGLVKTVAGVATVVSQHTTQPAAGDVVRAEYSGSSISWYVNDALIATVTDPDLATATRAGLQGDFNTDPTSAWDDFKVWTA